MSTLTPPLKWFGGKHYLARRIIDLMPPHLHYVEPCFGGGAVLLARDPDNPRLWLFPHKGVSEVVNDIDGRLINFWRVLRCEDQFAEFNRQVEAIPLSRWDWDYESDSLDSGLISPVRRAVAFFVRCRQSRAGMMKDFTSITRTRTRRQMNGNVSEWLGAVDGLADVHARLRRVLIEQMDAAELIEREDTPGTLFYVDPPYLHETRATRDGYRHEMSADDHCRLADALHNIEGKAMVSGYPSKLYETLYPGWRRETFDLPNNAAGGDTKRRMSECVWMNYQ